MTSKEQPRNAAPMSGIAAELGVGGGALRQVVDRLYRAGNWALGCSKTPDGGTVYDVEAVKVAVAPHLDELRERRCAHEARQADERAAAETRRAARAVAHAAYVAAKAGRSTGAEASRKADPSKKPASASPPHPRRQAHAPEIVYRRRPGPTP
jgi:hypothetical protein